MKLIFNKKAYFLLLAWVMRFPFSMFKNKPESELK